MKFMGLIQNLFASMAVLSIISVISLSNMQISLPPKDFFCFFFFFLALCYQPAHTLNYTTSHIMYYVADT